MGPVSPYITVSIIMCCLCLLYSGRVRTALQFSSGGASKRSIAISSIHISAQPAHQAASMPEPATRRPQGATGRPQGATGRPQGATGRPQGATGRPQGATGRPQRATQAGLSGGSQRHSHATKLPQDYTATTSPAEDQSITSPQDQTTTPLPTSNPPQNPTNIHQTSANPPPKQTKKPLSRQTARPPRPTKGQPVAGGTAASAEYTAPADQTNKEDVEKKKRGNKMEKSGGVRRGGVGRGSGGSRESGERGEEDVVVRGSGESGAGGDLTTIAQPEREGQTVSCDAGHTVELSDQGGRESDVPSPSPVPNPGNETDISGERRPEKPHPQQQKPRPPQNGRHCSKTLLTKPGLHDVTNTCASVKPCVSGGGRRGDGGEGWRGGRPRVGRTTQRMFVLSHAPMTGGGVATRGRGKVKVSLCTIIVSVHLSLTVVMSLCVHAGSRKRRRRREGRRYREDPAGPH